MVRIDHSGWCDQDQFLYTMSVLARKLRGQMSTEGYPHEIEGFEIEGIKQVEVMHDIVMQVGKARVISGFTKSRMVGHDDSKSRAQDSAKSKPSTVPAPWKKTMGSPRPAV